MIKMEQTNELTVLLKTWQISKSHDMLKECMDMMLSPRSVFTNGLNVSEKDGKALPMPLVVVGRQQHALQKTSKR